MIEQNQFEKAFEENKEDKFYSKNEVDINEKFDEMWEKAEKDLDKNLEEEYEKYINELISDTDIMEDIYKSEIPKSDPEVYFFSQKNEFLEAKNPLEIALDLISKGRTAEAILALEASLQKKNDDPQTWRILGKLHQENDQDKQAVACLLVIFTINY